MSTWLVRTSLVAVTLGAALATMTGCGAGDKGIAAKPGEPIPGQPSGPGGEPVGTTDFESDDTSSGSGQGGRNDSASGAADAGAAAPSAGAESDSKAANRAIEEADVIKVVGARLYALSRYGGLSIIDISVKDKLRLIGRQRVQGVPFEMYVRDGVVLAMYSGFGRWVYDDKTGGGSYQNTSTVVAFDTSDPAHIKEVGNFDIPGEISDSRLVGDVMYAVSYQNGYCWRCTSTPSTTVLSINLADVRSIRKVDELTFTSQTKSYSWWKRSISVTSDRMYIAGPEWNWDGNSHLDHSLIEVVDISDAGGKLSHGPSVQVAGQITSRWQMDEYDGVLRVVSQPGSGWWSNGTEPQVQTFKVGKDKFDSLGKTSIKLPRPENLMSVRFDGARAYAITAQRTDPLFTIDVSDPASPKQMGELEMPGWVYHMEPRGNRLIGLGYDQGNKDGAITVSLFDVSNLAKPSMIQRVNFGKGWGWLSEDQDRIHKSFQVLDDAGLILVPFSSYGGWWWDDGEDSCSPPIAGIQLIDFKNDTLVKRGLAKMEMGPRRAFLVEDRLFAMGDQSVATFNIDNRDAPSQVTKLELSTAAQKVVAKGDYVVQLASDGWLGTPKLFLTHKNDAETGTPTGTLDLGTIFVKPQDESKSRSCYYYYWGGWYNTRVFTEGQYVYLVNVENGYYYYDYDYANGNRGSEVVIAVVDISDVTKPTLVSSERMPLPANAGYWYGGYYGSGSYNAARDTVAQVGTTIAIGTYGQYYDRATRSYVTTGTKLALYDLSTPTKPRLASIMGLQEGALGSGLHVDGSVIRMSRGVPGSTGKLRYYVDSVDVSDPSSPSYLPSTNVPGRLLSFDAASSRMVTLDAKRVNLGYAADYQSCYYPDGYYANNRNYDYDAKVCYSWSYSLKLLDISNGLAYLRQTLPLDDARSIGQIQATGDRIAISYPSHQRYRYYSYPESGDMTPKVDAGYVQILSGVRSGLLAQASRLDFTATLYSYPWAWLEGSTIIVNDGERNVTIYDASNAASLRKVAEGEVQGWGGIYGVQVLSDRTIFALGEYGLQSFVHN